MTKSADKITFRKWDKQHQPQKFLIIRLHAIGDTALTLPACSGLRKLLPGARIDFLAGQYSSALPQALDIFDNVYEFPLQLSRSFTEKISSNVNSTSNAYLFGRRLCKNKYDIVIDLQHNRNTKIIRYLCGTKYWSEFNRYAPVSASKRTLDTFYNAGLQNVGFDFTPEIKPELISKAKEILLLSGWNGFDKLVVLNPAGLWVTRNWPLENYASLANLISQQFPAKFLMLGEKRILIESKYLSGTLGERLFNLVSKTTLAEAFAILSLCSLMVSEDSALYHMAWALGIPSILLLGSTRSDWTYHGNSKSYCFSSDDLPCGNCMQPECRFGDVHCLTRYTPEQVFERAKELLT